MAEKVISCVKNTQKICKFQILVLSLQRKDYAMIYK